VGLVVLVSEYSLIAWREACRYPQMFVFIWLDGLSDKKCTRRG